MNHHYNFCLKIFAVVGIVFVNIADNCAYADGAMTVNLNDVVNTPGWNADIIATLQLPTPIYLCPKGQYVYKCGNYSVGFNWLKSTNIRTSDSTSGTTDTYTTKNYYVVENENNITTDDMSTLFEQMRIFFGLSADTITYKNGTDTAVTTKSVFKQDRDKILNYVCNPLNTTITCAYCPNSASVDASTVQKNSSGTIKEGSWVFHTIADCYTDEFKDLTGTYHYIQSESAGTTEKCYYATTDTNSLSTLRGSVLSGAQATMIDASTLRPSTDTTVTINTLLTH